MNFTRKTLFWIIILILLGGAFYFSEQEAEKRRQIEAANLRLFKLRPQDVTEFWTRHVPEGEEQELEVRALRSQEGWHLTQPLSAKGDLETIRSLLKNVITARKDATLFAEASPEKLKELGLDEPQVVTGFWAHGEETVIRFGASGPTHNVAYAMFEGNPNVFRIHADVREEARASAYDLRDKNVLEFEPLKMRRFEAERRGKPRRVVEHKKGKWNLIEPEAGRAAMEKVVESLFEIKNAEVKRFADEEPKSLKAYGLEAPLLKLTVYQQEVAEPFILEVGKKDRAHRGYFARTNQAENIVTLEEGTVNALMTGMLKWRE